MQDSIFLRPAVKQDAAALAVLAAKTFIHTYNDFNTPENMRDYVSKYFTVKAIEDEIADPSVHTIIAFAGEQMCGYIKLKQGPSTYMPETPALEVARYYVDADFQGRKVGTLLMSAAETYAKTLGVSALWLGVWTQNPRAVAVYQHQGFNIAGTTIFQLGDDPQEDYVMVKML